MKLPHDAGTEQYGNCFAVVGSEMTAERFRAISATFSEEERTACIGWKRVGKLTNNKQV